jgi:hypothetical protein
MESLCESGETTRRSRSILVEEGRGFSFFRSTRITSSSVCIRDEPNLLRRTGQTLYGISACGSDKGGSVVVTWESIWARRLRDAPKQASTLHRQLLHPKGSGIHAHSQPSNLSIPGFSSLRISSVRSSMTDTRLHHATRRGVCRLSSFHKAVYGAPLNSL